MSTSRQVDVWAALEALFPSWTAPGPVETIAFRSVEAQQLYTPLRLTPVYGWPLESKFIYSSDFKESQN